MVVVTERGGADRVGDGDRAVAAATAVTGVVEEVDGDGQSEDDDDGVSSRMAGARKAHGTAAGCEGMGVVLLRGTNGQVGKLGTERNWEWRPVEWCGRD